MLVWVGKNRESKRSCWSWQGRLIICHHLPRSQRLPRFSCLCTSKHTLKAPEQQEAHIKVNALLLASSLYCSILSCFSCLHQFRIFFLCFVRKCRLAFPPNWCCLFELTPANMIKICNITFFTPWQNILNFALFSSGFWSFGLLELLLNEYRMNHLLKEDENWGH